MKIAFDGLVSIDSPRPEKESVSLNRSIETSQIELQKQNKWKPEQNIW